METPKSNESNVRSSALQPAVPGRCHCAACCGGLSVTRFPPGIFQESLLVVFSLDMGGVPLMGVSEGKIPLEWMIWGYPHLWKPPYVFSIWIDLICRFQSNQVEIKVGASCVRPARSEHFRESWWMLTLSDGQLTFPSQELSGPGSTKVIIRTKMQALHTSPTP